MKLIKKIILPEQKSNSKVLTRLRQVVLKGVNLKKNADIGNVVTLATYLYATGDKNIAVELLDNIVFDVRYSPDNQSLWESTGEGRLLRAFLADPEAESGLVDCVTNEIDKCGIESSDESRATFFIKLRKELKEYLSEAEISSQKSQCEIYASLFLRFVYYKMMLPSDNLKFSIAVDDEINTALSKLMLFLNQSLVVRRQSRVHRIQRHEFFDEKTYRWK